MIDVSDRVSYQTRRHVFVWMLCVALTVTTILHGGFYIVRNHHLSWWNFDQRSGGLLSDIGTVGIRR
jgi:hypothetical protein